MNLLVSGFLALAGLLQAQTATVQNAATLQPPAEISGNFGYILKGSSSTVSFRLGYLALPAPTNVIAPGMLAVLTYSGSGTEEILDPLGNPYFPANSPVSYSPATLTIRPSGSGIPFKGDVVT